MKNDVKAVMLKLLAYCQANQWAGYDPYDALNSKVLALLPGLNSRIPRVILTQALKRSPINIRPLLLIPKNENAKAIALFLSGLAKLPKNEIINREDLIELMLDRLVALRSKDTRYWCWGYSFPWQTRTIAGPIMVPAGAPNLVCTVFVSSALLDAYERERDSRCLSMALSAAEYVLNELYWSQGKSAGFSYPRPSIPSQTHNANFLAAALMCRVYRHTGDREFLTPALKVGRYSASRQLADGSWYYGEAPSQRWIDNFHTGYNLCALRAISQFAETTEFDRYIERGFEFYRTHFFRHDGAVKYFHNRVYPIDTHCLAQSMITLLSLRDLHPENVSLAHSVFRWSMDHMWDQRGFFYYRMLRFGKIRTSYMRWSQAWMFLALAMLRSELNLVDRTPPDSEFVGAPVSGYGRSGRR